MAVTLSLAITSVGPNMGDSTLNGIATITNTEAGAVTLQDIQVFEQSTFGATISQPYFLTPNVAPGVGNPSVSAGATVYYPFQVVCAVPNTPGASPNAPGGLVESVYPAPNTFLRLAGVVRALDGSSNPFVGTASLQLPLITPVAPFPVPQGGALQFNRGGNAVNFFFL